MNDIAKEEDFFELVIDENKLKVKWSTLQYMIVGAREGGSNDWVNQIIVNEPAEGTRFPVEMDLQVDAPGVEFSGFDESDPWTVYNSPFVDGGSLTIKHDQAIAFGPKQFTLNKESMVKGTTVMAKKYPGHFIDMMSGSDDATTHDVWMQCCVFGEIVFG